MAQVLTPLESVSLPIVDFRYFADDERLTKLYKQVMSLFGTEPVSMETLTMEISNFAHIAGTKAEVIHSTNNREIRQYEEILGKMASEIDVYRGEIEELNQRLAFEQVERKHREEYAALCNTILKYEDCPKLQSKIDGLNSEIAAAKASLNTVESELQEKSKLFLYFFTALDQLKASKFQMIPQDGMDSADSNLLEANVGEADFVENLPGSPVEESLTDSTIPVHVADGSNNHMETEVESSINVALSTENVPVENIVVADNQMQLE